MAGAGDCLGYGCGVGSARFARSAANGQAGWVPLASLALPRWVVLRTPKTKNVTKNVARCGPGGLTNTQTSILGSRAIYLLMLVTRISEHLTERPTER